MYSLILNFEKRLTGLSPWSPVGLELHLNSAVSMCEVLEQLGSSIQVQVGCLSRETEGSMTAPLFSVDRRAIL